MRVSCWCFLLVVFLSCEVRGAIWSAASWQDQITPREVSVPDSLLHGQGRSAGHEAVRLFRRQSSNRTNIGHTAALSGDNHPHGLVHWTGYPSEVLFMLTRSVVSGLSRESWLWRSTDYGHTFTNVTNLWNNNTIVNWYYIAPLSEYLIFADVINSMLWVTVDEGESYTGHAVPFTPNRITFQSRGAPGSNSTRLAQYVLGYDETHNQLWVSTNLGTSWRRLGENVTRYSWRVLDSSLENETTVYYEQAVNATHSDLYISTHPYTTSRRFEGLVPFLTDSFVLSNEYMFVQMSNSSSATQYSSPLWVSRNRRAFRQARFPLQSQERHYAVVDTSEGQVFLGVYHDINNTNLYLSEAEGVEYTLSLTSMISPPESEWRLGYPKFDLHVVEGLVGTFVANKRDPSSRLGSTVISYDKGGNWAQLRPPTLDVNGRFIECQLPNCSLHLHIQASRDTGYQSILTQDSAIGLIMAAGNLGSSLVSDNSQLRQYFSRDGGFTWLEVQTGYKQYQFAAQGAIVASVTVFQRTSSADWSCDEGVTWNDVGFVEESSSVNVIGMLTEIGERALHVTIFGIQFPFVEWLVIDLNFTPQLTTQCTQQDFFTWIPTDDRPGSRCLLGESITYERRRSENCCYVHPGYNRLISRSVCTCTQEDFECDFGFERIFINSPCTPIPGFQWPPPQPTECPEGHTYNISSGYRRVAGDKCIPGQELSYFPITRHCMLGAPKLQSLQSNSIIVTPQLSVTFSIVQIKGARVGTIYHWDYNDTTNVTLIGYKLAHETHHAFARPGVYNVSVLASNEQGQSFFSLAVNVLDPVSSVRIEPPSLITLRKEVPVGTQLVFGSTISTVYNSSLTGPIQYSWTVEGSSMGTTPTITHTFVRPGTYSILLTVVNAATHVASSSLAVNVLDRLTGVELQVPRDLVVDTEVTVLASYTSMFNATTGLVTFYWDFGEGQASSTTPSFTHTFPAPGNYTISLVADSHFSRSSVSKDVFVLDKLRDVSITVVHSIGGEVPAGLSVVFVVSVSTEFNTSFTGSLQYSWDFGDGASTTESSSRTTTHTYRTASFYTVSCTVQGPMVTKQVQLTLHVFEALDSSSVHITNSDLIENAYVLTQQELTWRVESVEDDPNQAIPPDTKYQWIVHLMQSPDVADRPTCRHVFKEESNEPEYNVTLPCWGPYQIVVIGNHSAGSFVRQLQVTAEANITAISLVGVPAVMRSGSVQYLTIVSESYGSAYQGPVTLGILDANSSALATPLVNYATSGSDTLLVPLSRDEATTSAKVLNITASNHVSCISKQVIVTLAVHGEYQELRFYFLTTQLAAGYKSSSYQDTLKHALVAEIKKRYLTRFHDSSVEIENSGFDILNSSDVSASLPERAVRSDSMEAFYVDLNILPASLQQQDIMAMENVTRNIVADSVAGSLSITVGGDPIRVASAGSRNSESTVLVPSTVVKQNTTLYIALGAGLGAGLLMILAVAVILGVVVYVYRRNYKRLNVRYARLRQTPVRFTFTQEGEMVEDEDYEEPSSDEEELRVGGARGVKLGNL